MNWPLFSCSYLAWQMAALMILSMCLRSASLILVNCCFVHSTSVEFLTLNSLLRGRCASDLFMVTSSDFLLFLLSCLWLCEMVLIIKNDRIFNQWTSDNYKLNREGLFGFIFFFHTPTHYFRDRIKALSYEEKQHIWMLKQTKGIAMPLLFFIPWPSQRTCRSFVKVKVLSPSHPLFCFVLLKYLT